MTDTTISGAVVFPQDVGSGVPEDEEDYSSAGFFSLLSKYKGEGSYVGEDTSGNPTLQFNDVDTSNEQVDVGTGYAYIMDSMSVQSCFQTVYDVALPNESPYVVILPDEVVNLDLGTDNVNDLWLAVDPTSNDSVYIRHGNGLTEPSDPFVKLGTVDTSSGTTTRTNDGAPSGAFRDEDGDNVYTLPNSTDGIDVGSVSTNRINTVVQVPQEYATLEEAFADISPSATSRVRIHVNEDITETGRIEAKSHVDVIGNGATVEVDHSDISLNLDTIEDSLWSNLTIHKTDTNTNVLLRPINTVAETVRFENVRFINESGRAAFLLDHCDAEFYGCRFESKSGDGCVIEKQSAPYLSGCTVLGGGGQSPGLITNDAAHPTIDGGFYKGGDGDNTPGIKTRDGSTPYISGAEIVAGDGDSTIRALHIEQKSSPTITGGIARPTMWTTGDQLSELSSATSIDPTGSGRPWWLYHMSVYVNSGGSSTTLDIGTSSGGDEIASGIDLTTSQTAPAFDFDRVTVSSANDIYITPSDTDAEFAVYITTLAYGGSPIGTDLRGDGDPTIIGLHSIGPTDGAFIRDRAIGTEYDFIGCKFESSPVGDIIQATSSARVRTWMCMYDGSEFFQAYPPQTLSPNPNSSMDLTSFDGMFDGETMIHSGDDTAYIWYNGAWHKHDDATTTL